MGKDPIIIYDDRLARTVYQINTVYRKNTETSVKVVIHKVKPLKIKYISESDRNTLS